MSEDRLHPRRVHLDIVVEGRVQGVTFRAGARDEAIRLGLDGQVHNLPDGRVSVTVEGDFEQVQEFLNWCHQGPVLAQVNAVTTAEGALEGLSGFVIR